MCAYPICRNVAEMLILPNVQCRLADAAAVPSGLGKRVGGTGA